MKRNTQIVEALVEHGATFSAETINLAEKLCEAGNQGDVKFVSLLNKSEVDLNTSNVDKRSVGHIAADEGRFNLLEFLASTNRFDFDRTDRWGKSTRMLIKESERLNENQKQVLEAMLLKSGPLEAAQCE
mmetsp:Transcript_14242/g.24223  ORF Transcript_14242/g.24223 Transcript_14242/m.24223 type:complete len:130 (-) Transcript_14242:28-417(-)